MIFTIPITNNNVWISDLKYSIGYAIKKLSPDIKSHTVAGLITHNALPHFVYVFYNQIHENNASQFIMLIYSYACSVTEGAIIMQFLYLLLHRAVSETTFCGL